VERLPIFTIAEYVEGSRVWMPAQGCTDVRSS
jgi:hypothetical protein